MSQIKLLSDVGADYTKLRDLLAAGDWLNADDKTARMLLMTVGKEEDRYLYNQDIEKLPCTDLCTIDQLWMYYSNKRFGFSIQIDQWQEVLRTRNSQINYMTFGHLGIELGWLTIKGWLDYGITSDLEKTPKGHFPRWGLDVRGFLPYTAEVTWVPGLWGLSRLSTRQSLRGMGGSIVVHEFLNNQFSELFTLRTFFSHLDTCNLVSTTAATLAAIEQIVDEACRNCSTWSRGTNFPPLLNG
jgi:hypothetical protein